MNKSLTVKTFKWPQGPVLWLVILAVLLGSLACARTAIEKSGDKTDTGSVTVNQPSKPAVRRMRDMPFEELVNVTVGLLNDFWKKSFDETGWGKTNSYNPPKNFTSYTQPVQTGCGPALMNNAFYCSLDHSIYYDDTMMRGLYKDTGDYAAVTVLAHEWGHLAQSNLGVLHNKEGKKIYYTIQTELQADCYAGAFAKYIFEQGYLEEGDLDEGGAALLKFGDPLKSPWFDPQAHGQPFQRGAFFNKGWENGVKACVAKE